MKKQLALFLIIILGYSCNRQDQFAQVKAHVKKTEWVTAVRGFKKIKSTYEYSYNDSIYTNFIIGGKSDPFYNNGDSLLLKIKMGGKHNPIILDCIYKQPRRKTVMASSKSSIKKAPRDEISNEDIAIVNEDKASSSFGVSYYLIDSKPLFSGATAAHMNDSLINKYIKERCALDKQRFIKGTALTISIDSHGKISKVNFFDNTNVRYNNYLEEVCLGMPKWQPGIRNGKNVKVAFNIILE
jgi:hypothetical protein